MSSRLSTNGLSEAIGEGIAWTWSAGLAHPLSTPGEMEWGYKPNNKSTLWDET